MELNEGDDDERHLRSLHDHQCHVIVLWPLPAVLLHGHAVLLHGRDDG